MNGSAILVRGERTLPLSVRGYSLSKHFIYGWAVVILIFEILPFSFRYDLLEFLFAKTYVCNVTAITTILYLPRIRSCIN